MSPTKSIVVSLLNKEAKEINKVVAYLKQQKDKSLKYIIRSKANIKREKIKLKNIKESIKKYKKLLRRYY